MRPAAPSEDPVWSESSLWAQWVIKGPSFLHADSEDSDQTGRMPFCWFCYEAAQIARFSKKKIGLSSPVSEDTTESQHDKTNKIICAQSEDSDQPGRPTSLIRVFAVRIKKRWVISYPLSARRRLWSDLVDAQADLSLRWAHMSSCWFCHALPQLLVKYWCLNLAQ